MKIGFVISSLNIGGAEGVLVTIANGLVKYFQDEVTIFKFDSGLPQYEIRSEIKIMNIDPELGYSNKTLVLYRSIKIYKLLKLALESTRIDYLISFITYTNCISILAAKKAGVPVIFSERIDPFDFHESLLISIFRKILYKKAKACVLQTLRNLDSFKRVKTKLPNKKFIIPNPLNEKFIIGNINWDQKDEIILSVGRLSSQKGQDLLLKVFFKVLSLSSGTKWKLIIIGEGSTKPELIRLSETLKIANNVFFCGTTREIINYYKTASVFILSSRVEGFPNALCEAMAMGCACVSFDCPTGPSEIIKNKINGFLIAPGAINDMADCVASLIRDPVLRRKIGSNAISIRDSLSPKYIVSKWHEAIETCSK